MLLFFDSLEGERVIAEWILNVTEVRLVGDDFLATSLIIKTCTEHTPIRIVHDAHHVGIVATLASVLDVALREVG